MNGTAITSWYSSVDSRVDSLTCWQSSSQNLPIIIMLVHLALARKAPTDITSLLQPITACPRSMTLRSATDAELFTPRLTLKFGERAFRISAPKAWNCLPHDVRLEACTNSFKRKLQTFLFKRLYC